MRFGHCYNVPVYLAGWIDRYRFNRLLPLLCESGSLYDFSSPRARGSIDSRNEKVRRYDNCLVEEIGRESSLITAQSSQRHRPHSYCLLLFYPSHRDCASSFPRVLPSLSLSLSLFLLLSLFSSPSFPLTSSLLSSCPGSQLPPARRGRDPGVSPNDRFVPLCNRSQSPESSFVTVTHGEEVFPHERTQSRCLLRNSDWTQAAGASLVLCRIRCG